jgi:hypothetical protein
MFVYFWILMKVFRNFVWDWSRMKNMPLSEWVQRVSWDWFFFNLSFRLFQKYLMNSYEWNKMSKMPPKRFSTSCVPIIAILQYMSPWFSACRQSHLHWQKNYKGIFMFCLCIALHWEEQKMRGRWLKQAPGRLNLVCFNTRGHLQIVIV